MCLCVYTYACTCMTFTYSHTYTYTYIHAHTHTPTHTQTLVDMMRKIDRLHDEPTENNFSFEKFKVYVRGLGKLIGTSFIGVI